MLRAGRHETGSVWLEERQPVLWLQGCILHAINFFCTYNEIQRKEEACYSEDFVL